MRIRSSVAALVLLLFCGFPLLRAAPAQAAAGDKLLALFESRYRSAKSLSSVFLEQLSENGKLTRKEAGRAYFLHPGKMRWDYEAPETNTFLVDGKYVWFYSPADHTATRMPAKKSEDWRTPLAFLTTDMKLSRICSRVQEVRDLPPAHSNNSVFRCLLRGKSDDETGLRRQVIFELSPEGDLSRIVIPQEGGIELEFSFKEWRWNPTLAKNWFEFAPSKGVAIVDGLLPDAPGMRQ